MTDEDLHALVYRETGKESLRKLTARSWGRWPGILPGLKDGVRRGHPEQADGPRAATRPQLQQRRKIWHLCDELGWNNDFRRIQGFVKKMTGTDRLEWLTPPQCEKVIEALKAILAREKRKGDEGRG